MTHDYIVRGLAYGGEIRAYAAITTESVQEAQTRHYTWPTASAAMGRTMTATVMMGAMLKGNQKLTVTVDGKGQLAELLLTQMLKKCSCICRPSTNAFSTQRSR